MQIINGLVKEQYERLWDYCEELLSCNPSSTVKIKCIHMGGAVSKFERLYVCLDACKKVLLLVAGQSLELMAALLRVFTRDSCWLLWTLIQTMQFIQ